MTGGYDADRLENVIGHAAAAAAGFIPEGMWLNRWMVVGFAQNPERPAETAYFRLYPSGTMPPHEAIGLLSVSADMILDDTRSPYEDDEG